MRCGISTLGAWLSANGLASVVVRSRITRSQSCRARRRRCSISSHPQLRAIHGRIVYLHVNVLGTAFVPPVVMPKFLGLRPTRWRHHFGLEIVTCVPTGLSGGIRVDDQCCRDSGIARFTRSIAGHLTVDSVPGDVSCPRRIMTPVRRRFGWHQEQPMIITRRWRSVRLVDGHPSCRCGNGNGLVTVTRSTNSDTRFTIRQRQSDRSQTCDVWSRIRISTAPLGFDTHTISLTGISRWVIDVQRVRVTVST